MYGLETAAFQSALRDFALASGYLVILLVDRDRKIKDYNRGFEICVQPAGDVRNHPLETLLCDPSGNRLDLMPGLKGGAPVPHLMRAAGGQNLLLHAYPFAHEQVLLIGNLLTVDESLSMQRMSRLTTEMGNLVRQLRRANRQIQDLANKDALTGLASRRYFFERLDGACEHASRHGRPLSLLMTDLDHFKRVNDRHGHPGGDIALRAFAELLLRRARAGDLPGRLGGEEFALLLPDTDCEQAVLVAERLRKETLGLRPLGSEAQLSVSVGVAQRYAEERVTDLVTRADQALYSAKGAGRDCVVMAAAEVRSVKRATSSAGIGFANR